MRLQSSILAYSLLRRLACLAVVVPLCAMGAAAAQWPAADAVEPRASLPAIRDACPGRGLLLETPGVGDGAVPPDIEPAQVEPADAPLPINLATALCLSNARPLVIAFAQANVEESVARLQKAGALWLPNLNVGTNYYRHDGLDMRSTGNIINVDKSSFMGGAGATLDFGVTDAIFRPLADRQELSARRADLQAARNDALLAVTAAYFEVQQFRGTLAGALDTVAKAETLVRKTEGLAVGLVPPIEVDRSRAALSEFQQRAAAARGKWRIASARLTRILRLNPAAVVIPVEPPHLQIDLFAAGISGDSLISVGLANRPEIAAQRALVQASGERVRQEEVRPFVPNIVLQGANGPSNPLLGGVFGGGRDADPQRYGGRFDFNLAAVWTLSNLGAGNRAMVRERCAQQDKAAIDLANMQDQVAEEVVQSLAQLEMAAKQIGYASAAVREAAVTFQGTLTGLGQTARDGELLRLVNRPVEAVTALEQLNRAYENYYAAVNGYNRAQFQLYRSVGFPARIVVCDRPVGAVEPIDLARPREMPPVCRHMLSQPCPPTCSAPQH